MHPWNRLGQMLVSVAAVPTAQPGNKLSRVLRRIGELSQPSDAIPHQEVAVPNAPGLPPEAPRRILTGGVLRQVYSSDRIAARRLDVIAEELTNNLDRAGLNSELRIAHFMAQVWHETGPSLRLEENFNYSVAGLIATFSYYRNNQDQAAVHGRTDTQPANQEAIANCAYANRIGNGAIASGDGWRFRGRGLIQLTGRGNYQAFTRAHQTIWGELIDFVQDPDLLALEKYAVRSAIEFWLRHRLFDIADEGDDKSVTDRITGVINRGTNDASRQHRYANLRAIIDQQVFRNIG
jgi:predicted chitinase